MFDKTMVAVGLVALAIISIMLGAALNSANKSAKFEKWCIISGGRVIRLDQNSFCAKNIELIKENEELK